MAHQASTDWRLSPYKSCIEWKMGHRLHVRNEAEDVGHRYAIPLLSQARACALGDDMAKDARPLGDLLERQPAVA
jgi:hypothetical protein